MAEKARKRNRTRKGGHKYVYFCTTARGKPALKWKVPETQRYTTRTWESLGVANPSEALKYAQEKSKELISKSERGKKDRRRRLVDANWTQFMDVYRDEFIEEHSLRSWKKLHRDYLEGAIEYLRQCVRRPAQLDFHTLRAYRNKISKERKRVPVEGGKFKTLAEKRSRHSVNRHLSAVQTLFRWARKLKYITMSTDDIADALEQFKAPKAEPVVLSRKDLRNLMDALIEHDRCRYKASRRDKQAYYSGEQRELPAHRYSPMTPYILISMLTGMRPEEVKSLKVEDCDLENDVLQFDDYKESRVRTIPLRLSPVLRSLLTSLVLRSGGKKFLLSSEESDSPKNVRSDSFDRLTEMAGIGTKRGKKCTPKHFRSTTVSWVASAGLVPEYQFQQIFGHDPSVSAKHYRRPKFDATGETIEAALGIEEEAWKVLKELGYSAIEGNVKVAEKASS